MKRINSIYHHALYAEELSRIKEDEENRIYCKHDVEHFLAVARLMMLISAEKGLAFPREQVYAAALLHDIGRSRQYRDGVPHETAGVDIANAILPECGFSDEEIRQITTAIAAHRENNDTDAGSLGEVLYSADKKSRLCFCCSAEDSCKWEKEQKNYLIEY